MIFAAFILHFVYPNPLIVGLVLLAIATLGHLIARLFEPETPSFHTEAEKGTLDFLRLLPFSAHQTVLVRAFPAFAFRLYLTILWLPLYSIAFNFWGISTTSAFCFAALVGTCNPFTVTFVLIWGVGFPEIAPQLKTLFATLSATLLPWRPFFSSGGVARMSPCINAPILFVAIQANHILQGHEFALKDWLPFYAGSLPLLQAMALLFLAQVSPTLTEQRGGLKARKD